MSYMRFCVMDVGQGSANYVELRENNGSLSAAAIIDIGSEQWKTAAGRPSAEWIAEELEQMIGGAALDVVILSHSDSDHVNLIPSLLEHFDTPEEPAPTKPVLEVRRVVYGGVFAKYAKGRSKNFLYQVAAYHPTGVTADAIIRKLDDDYSSFDGPAASWKPLATVGGEIPLWALSANTTAEMIPGGGGGGKRARKELPDGGFATNTRSIVVAAIFERKTIVATGDATGLTLAHCNQALSKKAVRDKLAPAVMVTLPHHGSDTTTYDMTGSDHGSDAAKKNVVAFCKRLNADTISGSAGERRTFKHPSAQVIADFGASTLAAPQYVDPALIVSGEHFYTAYFKDRTLSFASASGVAAMFPMWPLFEWWYTARTIHNVYTTDYFAESVGTPIPIAYPWNSIEDAMSKFVPPPPRGISWGFIVRENRTIELEVVRERTATSAAYWAAAEAVHGPLPRKRFVVVPSAPLPDENGQPDGPAGPLPRTGAPPPGPGPPRIDPPLPPLALSRLRQLP